MAVVILDSKTRADWVTAIPNTASPSAATLNAGTPLTKLITPDGLDIKPTTGKKDVSNLGSKGNSDRVTRVSWDVNVTFYHDDQSDTAWNLFTKGTMGFLVVRSGVDKDTPYAAGDNVKVYPLQAGEPQEVKPAPEERWTFDLMFAVWDADQVNQRAVCAA